MSSWKETAKLKCLTNQMIFCSVQIIANHTNGKINLKRGEVPHIKDPQTPCLLYFDPSKWERPSPRALQTLLMFSMILQIILFLPPFKNSIAVAATANRTGISWLRINFIYSVSSVTCLSRIKRVNHWLIIKKERKIRKMDTSIKCGYKNSGSCLRADTRSDWEDLGDEITGTPTTSSEDESYQKFDEFQHCREVLNKTKPSAIFTIIDRPKTHNLNLKREARTDNG